ncbi:hypothetical protein ACM66B_000894 [Microbotryomycetes sp. NB124-2]
MSIGSSGSGRSVGGRTLAASAQDDSGASQPSSPARRRQFKNLSVNVPDPAPFLAAASASRGLVHQHPTSDPSAFVTAHDDTDDDSDADEQLDGFINSSDWAAHSGMTPVSLPIASAGSSAPRSRPQSHGQPVRTLHAEHDSDRDALDRSGRRDTLSELNGGFGGASVEQSSGLGLGLGLGTAGEQVAREMRMQSIESLRAGSVSPRTTTARQQLPPQHQQQDKSKAIEHVEMVLPRSPQLANIREPVWDRSSASLSSDSSNSSPPMPTAARDSLLNEQASLPVLSPPSASQSSTESIQPRDSGTFVSVASGPLAQLASTAQPRASRTRGARALISNLLSRSPRSQSGGSPRMGDQTSSSFRQTAPSSPSNRQTGWAAVSTGSDPGSSQRSSSNQATSTTHPEAERTRGTPRSTAAAATFGSPSRAVSTLLSAGPSTSVRRAVSASSSPQAQSCATVAAATRVPDTPATIGMSTPVADSSPSEPAPTLASLGLSVALLTQSLSLSKTGIPLCGAILDGKYLLIGTTQSLDFLPLPAPGSLAGSKDKRKATRKPISLIKKTRFKDLAVLSERSNILLAIAGRNDHVRVYALDSVRALIRRKLAEVSQRDGYPAMQDSHLRQRDKAKTKASTVPVPAPVPDRLEDLAPLPSPPPQYDTIATQRPQVRRISSRPGSWHQSQAPAFLPPPPSPNRPMMARGSSGTIVDSVPRNPRGSISSQGGIGAASSSGVRHVRGQKSREFVASRRGSAATVISRRRSRADVAGLQSPSNMSRRSSYASAEHGRRQSSAGFTLTPGTSSFESQNLSVTSTSATRQLSETASDSGWTTSNGPSPRPPVNDYFSQPVSPRTLVPPSMPGLGSAASSSTSSLPPPLTPGSSSDGVAALPFPSRPRSTRAAPRRRPQSVVPRSSSSEYLSSSARLLPRKPTTVASPTTDVGIEAAPEREVLSLAEIIRDGPPPSSLPASTSAPQLRLTEAGSPTDNAATASSARLGSTPDGSPTNRQMKRWTVGGVGSRLLNRSGSNLGEPRSVSPGPRATSMEESRSPREASASVSNARVQPPPVPEFKRRHSELATDEGESADPQLDGISVDAHLAAATSALEYVKLARTKGAFSFKAIETKKKTYLAVLCGEEGERVELFTGSRTVSLALNRTFVLPEAPRAIEFQLQGDDLVDIYLLYHESIFAIEPSTVRVREVGVGRAERRARRERERRLQQASAAAVSAFADAGPMSTTDAFLHPADPARDDQDEGALPVASTSAADRSATTDDEMPSTAADAARDGLSRSSSLSRPLPATPVQGSSSPSEPRSRLSKPSLPYTTFQQLPFVPPVPSSVLSSAWTIPPLYADVVTTSSPNPGSSGTSTAQPPLLSPVSLLSGAAPRGHGRPNLFFVSKGDSLSGIVTAEGKSVIKRPMVWTSNNSFSVGEPSAIDAPRRLEMLVSGETKTFVVSISSNEVKAIAVQGGVNEPSFTAAAKAHGGPADSVQWLGTHAHSSQLFFAERNGQHIVFKCLTVAK